MNTSHVDGVRPPVPGGAECFVCCSTMPIRRTANGMTVTAIIPAAGRATRLGSAVSGSKEVAVIGGRPAVGHLLHRLSVAGIDRAIVALRTGKWDIPTALTGEAPDSPATAYVVVEDSPSPAHTIAAAVRFVPDDVVALGFPDVMFEPVDAFAPMLTRLVGTNADVVLGVFPSQTPERVDMVRLDEALRVAEIVIKQPDRGLRYCWTLAVWTPRFSDYLLHRIADHDDRAHAASGDSPRAGEFQIGAVIQDAIDAGMPTESVVFDGGRYIDVGTPDDLNTARSLLEPGGGS
jgi:glucose-1-phosphate thymidylyltransferase